jgi:hypothetical protein
VQDRYREREEGERLGNITTNRRVHKKIKREWNRDIYNGKSITG